MTSGTTGVEELDFPGHGGDRIDAVLVSPSVAPDVQVEGNAIVLVHEVYGLDPHVREIAARFAAEGFTVLAPDLYSRDGLPGPAANDAEPAPVWPPDAIRAAVRDLPDRRALADLDAAAKFLGERAGVEDDCIAVVGFCMGGTLAFMSGCTSTRFAAVVDFYGRPIYAELSESKPVQPLELLLNLDRRLLAFFGEEDASISMEHVELMRSQLEDASKDFEVVTYPGAGHGFFNHRRAGFHEPSARDAWQRTLAFLNETL